MNLRGRNWLTGEPSFHYVIGGQKYNSAFQVPQLMRKAVFCKHTIWSVENTAEYSAVKTKILRRSYNPTPQHHYLRRQ